MANYQSYQSGDWSDTATWENLGGGGNPTGPPGDGDTALIQAGHNVQVDGNVTLGTDPANNITYDLHIYGTLSWKDTVSVDRTFTMKGNVQIHTGGLLEIGNDSNPIPASSTATWKFPSGNYDYWRIYIQNTGGSIKTRGATAYHMADADKQKTTLAAAISSITASSDQVAVADDGGAQTTETAEANDANPNDMTLLPNPPANDDAYYWGDTDRKFSKMTLNIGQAGSGAWNLYWEYWNGTAWVSLPDVQDGTNRFMAAAGSHDVQWNHALGWQKTDVNGINAYWIRARVYNYSSCAQQPLGTQSWVYRGADQTIQFSDAVDYEVGDEIWLGKGADKTLELWDSGGSNPDLTYSTENVILKTKINASTYTADVAYEHTIGDMAFNTERNVIFDSDLDNTFRIEYYNPTNGAWLLDMQWTKIRGQKSGWWIFYIWGSSAPGAVVQDCLYMKNCAFTTDRGGHGVYIGRYTVVSMDDKEFDNIHMGGLEAGFLFGVTYTNDGGRVSVGDLVALISNYGIWAYYRCDIENLWYCCTQAAPSANRDALYIYDSFYVENMTCHCSYEALYLDTYNRRSHGRFRIDNAKIYHSKNYGIWLYDSDMLLFELNDAEIYDTRLQSIRINFELTRLLCNRCSFDNCGRNGEGVFTFADGVLSIPNIIFRECTMGTQAQNYTNIQIDSANIAQYETNRLIFEKCIIKKPTEVTIPPAIDYNYWPEILFWVVGANGSLYEWYDQDTWVPDRTIELVDCQILNASDVDQWATTFPDSNRLLICGGTFITEEPTIRLDGTIGIKAQPLPVFGRNACNIHAPIEIPIDIGETITAKVSFRKDKTMPVGRRPAIHMTAPGAEEDLSEMSDVINSWEEVQISRTAVLKGMAKIWFTVGCNEQALIDSFRQPKVRGTRNVYIDGFSVERS